VLTCASPGEVLVRSDQTPFTLKQFLEESNMIEGIFEPIVPRQLMFAEAFLALDEITVGDLETIVNILQPGARLRKNFGENVRVGRYSPMPGGPKVEETLKFLALTIREPLNPKGDPREAYKVHQMYESLHPFTDGNGRSGRLLWLWMMGGIDKAPLGFLHHWYYQSLEFGS
jgi:Fic family protein